MQDTSIYGAADEEVLEYSAATQRILLTHDKKHIDSISV
ncbi:MAG: hypothetical protein IPK17_38135 [Chloroflexi bacterium]|nr:hypothetical protein [Chloroflexota bacterium]